MLKDIEILTPVSTLFKDNLFIDKAVALSDGLELRDNGIKTDKRCKAYHCELNMLVEWKEEEINMLKERMKQHNFDVISFHLHSRYQTNKIENRAFVGVGNPYSISEMKKNLELNCKTARKILGDIPILVENNNHLKTDAYDIVTDASFISEIIKENNLFLLLDIAHAQITSVNTNIGFDSYISNLPLDRCMQIHLSKPLITEENVQDVHEALEDEDWQIFEEITERLELLKYVTIEYYKDQKKLLDQLTILRKMKISSGE